MKPNPFSLSLISSKIILFPFESTEYIWNYYFYQDGSIDFEIRLTGILQIYVSKDNDEPTPYGVKVAPNLNAQYHQHMFSIRIDPMIDGLKNSVVETDVISLPNAPTGSAANYAGNAFLTRDTVIKKESGRKYEYDKERRWRIINSGKKHYSSGLAVGYTLGVKGGATPMMVRPDSWVGRRASFLRNTVWVCRDVEGGDDHDNGNSASGSLRMWPAGKYVPQTREEPKDSVGSWVEGEMGVEDEDILVYLTVGKELLWAFLIFWIMMILMLLFFFYRDDSYSSPRGLASVSFSIIQHGISISNTDPRST